ncbi:MAG: hypothetical protein LBS84_03060 [Clostridiales bacterium]|jgi:hypothetical protein|nr:hypothetical protein [Clostridiales bacterium]
MRNMSSRTKRIIVTAIAVTLALLILLGSTYAYRDFTQHRSNDMRGVEYYDITLVEEGFEFENDWDMNETLPKAIYVTYPNPNTNLEKGSMYVRVAMKELLQIQPPKYQYYKDSGGKPIRFMVDETGNFIHATSKGGLMAYDTEDEVLAAWLADPFNKQYFIKPFTQDHIQGNEGYFFGPTDGSWNDDWFVMTDMYAPNGQYGKYMVVDQGDGTGEMKYLPTEFEMPAEPGPLLPLYEDENEHPEHNDAECGFPFYVWPKEPSKIPTFNLAEPDIRSYIKWNYDSANFIFIENIGSLDQEAAGVWIIDTASNFAYWSKALRPGETTTNLLDSVKLLHKPEGEFWYSIHADMEAVSFDQMAEWEYDGDDESEAADYPVHTDIVEFYTDALNPTEPEEPEEEDPVA